MTTLFWSKRTHSWARDDLFGKDLLPKGQNDLGVVRDVPSSMTDAEIILARTENGFKPCAARRF